MTQIPNAHALYLLIGDEIRNAVKALEGIEAQHKADVIVEIDGQKYDFSLTDFIQRITAKAGEILVPAPAEPPAVTLPTPIGTPPAVPVPDALDARITALEAQIKQLMDLFGHVTQTPPAPPVPLSTNQPPL